MNDRFTLATVILGGILLTAPSLVQAQVYAPGYSYGHSCWGWGYVSPVHPYGNWPGYPAAPGSYGPLGGYPSGGYSPGTSYPTQAANDRVILPYTPKHRDDAYSVNELLEYGLPAHPMNYQPPAAPKGKWSPSGQSKAPKENQAKVEVQVPTAAADVWVQGVKMKTGGTVRQFISPPLGADGPYQYKVEARWPVNGQYQTQTKFVSVLPGNKKVVVFE